MRAVPSVVRETRQAEVLVHGVPRPSLTDRPSALDLHALAEELDVRIVYDPQLRYSGVTEWSGSRATIRLRNDSTLDVRRRFTLAHELGHVILERHRKSGVEGLPNGGWGTERLCDAIAGELLLPNSSMNWVRHGPITLKGLIEVAIQHFVSLSAVAVRARRVGRPVRLARIAGPGQRRFQAVIGIRRELCDLIELSRSSVGILSGLPQGREQRVELDLTCEMGQHHLVGGRAMRTRTQILVVIVHVDQSRVTFNTSFCPHVRS